MALVSSSRRARRLLRLMPAGVACLGMAAASARADVTTTPTRVIVRLPGATATVTRSPFRLAIQDAAGDGVLDEASANGQTALVDAPIPQAQAGTISPPGPALYAPLAFTVGAHANLAAPAGQYEGNLIGNLEGGVEYSATGVIAADPDGSGARLTLSTSDPSGRQLVLEILPAAPAGLRIAVRPTPADGVAVMSDSFSSPPGEAFHGFGGRHDTLDQHGNQFLNWLQQENTSAGFAQPLVSASPAAGGSTYLFPNGPSAAYYVQSSFVSSAGYGFLLDRNEISDWRMDSDRPDAWRTSVAAPALDYVVQPGDGATAIAALTSLEGRQRVPPAWAVGPLLDRETKYPSDPPSQYASEVQDDIANIDRYHLPVAGYRIEGWQQLAPDLLAQIIGELKQRGIHPLLYFRAFVGQDTTGTDDPAQYQYALDHRYVATSASGQPYTFISNFNANAAVIDFTNPAAVAWWQGRIRQALDLGADGFMQDFGEQVQPDMHFADGETGASMHNRLPLLYHAATRQIVDAYMAAHPGRQIFFFSRAGYSGTPGSTASEGANFPGDETTDFTRSGGLASQTTDMLNRAIGGAYGFSTDIGGYFDLGPYQGATKELFIRWAEWAALSPLFRLHGSLVSGVHTPWSYDHQTVDVYEMLTRLHQRAAPLILSLWNQAQATGIPITRPLWLADPADPAAARQDQEWLLGPDVLVAPVVDPGANSRGVFFPRGCWRSPERGDTHTGPVTDVVAAPVATLPYYFRCGTHPFDVGTGTGACVDHRHFVVPLPFARRGRVIRATVYVNGRRVRVVRGHNIRRVILARLPVGRFLVRVVARTSRHATVTSTRSYRGCRQTRRRQHVRQRRRGHHHRRP